MTQHDTQRAAHAGTGLTKAVDSDDGTVKADVLGPGTRHPCLNRHALAAAAGENFFLVLGGLLVVTVLRGHGDDASGRAEFGGGSECVLQLAAAGQDDGVEGRGLLNSNVAAGQHAVAAGFHGNLGQIGQGLAREAEHGGAVSSGEGSDKSSGSFLGVGGTNDCTGIVRPRCSMQPGGQRQQAVPSMLGIRRMLATVSTGWCVGPSSPTPTLSCVKM